MTLFNPYQFYHGIKTKSVLIDSQQFRGIGEYQDPYMRFIKSGLWSPIRRVRPVLIQHRHRDHSTGGIEKGERSLDLVSKDGRHGAG